MSVKRYDVEICNCADGAHIETAESNDGNYVTYDDYTQQAQELERVNKECASLAAGSCEAPYGDDYGNKRCKTIDGLTQQLAASQARCREMEEDQKAALGELLISLGWRCMLVTTDRGRAMKERDA